MLRGHQLISIFDRWILDMTEFKLYEVNKSRFGKVTGMTYIGHIVTDGDTKCMDVRVPVPTGTVRAAYECIDEKVTRRREALYGVL